MRIPLLLLVLAAACCAISGCFPSNVVDVGDRAVRREEPVARDWRAVSEERQILGLWDSEQVAGEGSDALLKITYYFAPDHRYGGAALIVAEESTEFQTLNGAWNLRDGLLDLHDQSGALEVAVASDRGDLLRLRSAAGEVVLRKQELR